MKKKYFNLLGKQVLPIVKRSMYGAAVHDRIGNLNYLSGDERIKYARRVVDDATREQRKINKSQTWWVYAIKANGEFTLLSDYGYSQDDVSRSDFRVIKNGKDF